MSARKPKPRTPAPAPDGPAFIGARKRGIILRAVMAGERFKGRRGRLTYAIERLPADLTGWEIQFSATLFHARQDGRAPTVTDALRELEQFWIANGSAMRPRKEEPAP